MFVNVGSNKFSTPKLIGQLELCVLSLFETVIVLFPFTVCMSCGLEGVGVPLCEVFPLYSILIGASTVPLIDTLVPVPLTLFQLFHTTDVPLFIKYKRRSCQVGVRFSIFLFTPFKSAPAMVKTP